MYFTKNTCLCLLLLLLFSALPVAAQPASFVETHAGQAFLPTSRAQEALDEQLADWQTFDLDLEALERQVRTTGAVTLLLGGQAFELELEPADVLAPEFRAVEVTPDGREIEVEAPTGTYRGRLAKQPGSEVRLLVLPDFLQGYVKTEDDWFFLDPIRKFDRGAPWHQIVLFREDDVRPGGQSLCGSGALHAAYERFDVTDDEIFEGASANLVTTGFRADLATEADFEYRQLFGSATHVHIAGIVNQVNGIMKPELGVSFQITFMRSWLSSNDPYSSTDPETLLNQFKDEWNNNPPTVTHDVAHLFTGKNLAGSTIGIAFVGAVCDFPDFSFGLSQNYSLMVKLVAHEIGHNYDAEHDDEVVPPASTCNGNGTIMCSIIQGGALSHYSDRSKTDVTNFIDGNSCMVAVTPDRPLSISIVSERCRGLHTVTWRATGGTTSYRLERSTSSTFSNATQVYSGNRTNYTGSQAGYYYRVRSCNSLGCSSFRSSTSRSTYHPGCF